MKTGTFLAWLILFGFTAQGLQSKDYGAKEEQFQPITEILKIDKQKCVDLGSFHSCTMSIHTLDCKETLWGHKRIPAKHYARIQVFNPEKVKLGHDKEKLFFKNSRGKFVMMENLVSLNECNKT